MNDLITLSKSSPDFEAYLLGTFAKDKRALPMQTLNVNSAAETVTFRIVPVQSIQRPSFIEVILQTFKVKSFLLILMPLFLVLTKNIVDNTLVDPVTSSIATVGVLLAFIAVNLRNDYMDHMMGVDRILEKSGSRAIQNGWVTAAQVKFYSNIFLSLAILCSLPIVLIFPQVAIVILLSAVIGIWAQFKKKSSFKYQIGGELALFLLLGPFLTVGYQLSMGARFDSESIWIGCVWGWLVLFVVHLRNFVNILPSMQAGYSNTVNWLGFDKSRRMIAAWWALFVVFNLAYHSFFAGTYWGFHASIVLVLMSVSFTYKLKNVSSSTGSDLRIIFKYGFQLFLITIGLWVFECLWYLYH
ncbi:MAG: prenyltransferase [Pseudobdellovibrionaceae bacterium]